MRLPARRSVAALVVLAVVAGCGERGGGNGLSAAGARFATRIHERGVTLAASGHNCSGLYGSWEVELRVSGAAKGSGATRFTLRQGREAQAPVSFKIRAGGILSGRAVGLLRIRARGAALEVRGLVRVRVPFRSVSQSVSETVAVTRGAVPGCGLSSA